ncbi:hypothetical protein LINPERHAP1_LOCUS24286 [Linum perenne]
MAKLRSIVLVFCVLLFTLVASIEGEQAPIYSASSFSLLPTYDPASNAAKKEKSRLRSAENAVHFIPLLLLGCAVILWFFSDPESRI